MVLQELLCFAAATAFIFLVVNFTKARIFKLSSSNSSELIPLPGPFNFPFIGSIIQIGIAAKRGKRWEQYQNICKRYGRVMGARVGSLNIGMLFSHGEVWKEMRRFSIRTLGGFGFGELNTANHYLDEELCSFLEYFEKLRLQSKNALKMNGLFKIPLVNILWPIVMGVRLEYGDKEALNIIRLVEKLAEFEFGLHPYFAFPWMKHIPALDPVRAPLVLFGEALDYFRTILHERRLKLKANTRKGSISTQPQTNFMDRLIHKVEQEKDNSETMYTDEQLLCVLMDILSASLDTTSNSFEFGILYMMKYPEVQKKVQAELDRVIGANRVPDVYDRVNLPFTQATMLETLRHSNVAPLQNRTSTCDTVLNGYHVPENTYCTINATAIHMDKEIWGDPEAFRPERFLDENNKIIKENKLLAFGGGRRVCIGAAVAKVTWLTFFSALLQKYTFEASGDSPIDTTPISGFTNTARTFYCNVQLR